MDGPSIAILIGVLVVLVLVIPALVALSVWWEDRCEKRADLAARLRRLELKERWPTPEDAARALTHALHLYLRARRAPWTDWRDTSKRDLLEVLDNVAVGAPGVFTVFFTPYATPPKPEPPPNQEVKFTWA